jgi:hypothetical protein
METITAVIRQGGPAYEALIVQAVADVSVYESVHSGVVSLFTESTHTACVRAIRVAEHLGDRKFASYLAGQMVKIKTDQDDLPSWFPDALAFVGQTLVPTDPKRRDVFELALSCPQTRIQGWRMARQGDALALMPWIPVLLRDYPEETVAIGIKFALVWQYAIPQLAEVLRSSEALTPETLSTLMDTLETYLLRVRRVRLWREFSRALKSTT